MVDAQTMLQNYQTSFDRDLAHEHGFEDVWPITKTQLNSENSTTWLSGLVAITVFVEDEIEDFPVLIRTKGLTLAAFCVLEEYMEEEWEIVQDVIKEIETRTQKPLIQSTLLEKCGLVLP